MILLLFSAETLYHHTQIGGLEYVRKLKSAKGF